MAIPSKRCGAWLACAALTSGIQAAEITGPEAQALYETLRKSGAEPDNFAGGASVQVREMRCFMSHHAPPATRYRCTFATHAGPSAPVAQRDEISAIQDHAAKTEALIAARRLREGRLALDALEKQVQAWRQTQRIAPEQHTDLDERVAQMQRYLVCEENRAKLPPAQGSVSVAKERVLHALKVLDTRLLAGWLSCDAVFVAPHGEPERLIAPDTLAQRLIAARTGPLKVASSMPTRVNVRGFRDDWELRIEFRGERDGRPAQAHSVIGRTWR